MALAEAAQAALINLLDMKHVLTREQDRLKGSRDETHGLKAFMPDAVLLPQSHEHVVKIAEICTEFGIPMTPRGAGTGKSGGCVPVQGGVVLDFTGMNRIVEVNPIDFTATVEPGVILGDFQRHVEAMGLFYPPDPASLDWCTLGGNVAENAGGPSAVKYGVTRDYLLGLRIVLSNGQSMRVGKRTIKGVTGLDLVSLVCGSEGVLAFVTEITLRLLAKPSFTQVAFCLFDSREAAINASVKVRRCGAVPRCIEFIDEGSLDALRRVGEGLGSGFGDAKALLFVEVDADHSEHLLYSLATIDKALVSPGYLGTLVAKDQKERREFWEMRRSLSEATKRASRYKVSEDVVVPLSNLNAFLQDVDAIAKDRKIKVCSFGHAGDGNLHVQILFDDDSVKESIPLILRELFEVVVKYGGTLTGEHGVGIAKMPFLTLEQEPSVVELQRRIKAAFDPSGLLNPGKFL